MKLALYKKFKAFKSPLGRIKNGVRIANCLYLNESDDLLYKLNNSTCFTIYLTYIIGHTIIVTLFFRVEYVNKVAGYRKSR